MSGVLQFMRRAVPPLVGTLSNTTSLASPARQSLGHSIEKKLTKKTSLSSLLSQSAKIVFSERMKVSARKIDRDYLIETEMVESIPHQPR